MQCDVSLGNTGVAIVRFKDHSSAKYASGLFETNGIGKQAWLTWRQNPARNNEHKIHGWLAEQEDMLVLPNKDKNGKDRFKWTLVPLANIPDQHLETKKQNEVLRERLGDSQNVALSIRIPIPTFCCECTTNNTLIWLIPGLRA